MLSPRRGGTITLLPLRHAIHAVAVFAFLGMRALTASAQTSDVTPPILQDLSLNPAAIDVSGGPRTVAMALRVTDDLSGVTFVSVTFRGPVGVTQSLTTTLSRISGTPLDGIWAGNVVFPQFAAAGTWSVSIVQVLDVARNGSAISTTVLASRGFPTDVAVTSIPDTQLPIVTGASVSPTAIDVSGSDQTVTVNLQVTDDLSGVAFAPCVQSQIFNNFSVTMRSPSGAQNRFTPITTYSLISGTRLNGTWRATFTMPRYSEAGTWRIQAIQARDCAGNLTNMTEAQIVAAGLQIGLNVTANPADIQAPTLTSFSFAPIAINTSTGNQSVVVRFAVADNLSGADFSPTTPQLSFIERGVEFRSPSGNQFRAATTFAPFTLVSGTPQNGVWESTLVFPQFSEDGTWTIDFFGLKDRVRNMVSFTPQALQAQGFLTTLEVIKPSLVTDGTVGSTGGVVSDQVFGDRASVFFPVGALTTNTQVAIDVLSKPLNVPNPTGFTGPGTLFVNIHLTPEPHFPLSPPGLTVILPLPNPMISGTQLSLYKVDPATGALVPAVNVFGGPVIGHVDADGLSATFFGIASLSTVVGLVPEALNVGVDIKPGDSPNTINLKSRGVLPVAILSTASFDARTVLPETVLLAGAGVRLKGNGQPAVSFEDVNGDGRVDMLIQFDTESLELNSNDTEAHLTGRTKDGLRIVGHDSIRIVPQ